MENESAIGTDLSFWCRRFFENAKDNTLSIMWRI